MLQVIRDNMQSFFAWIIIGFLVILMAMFGVDAFFAAPRDKGVVEINGEAVSNAELQQAIQMQKARLRQMMGDRITPAMLDDEMLRGPALETLIQRRLMLQQGDDWHLTVSGAMLTQMITSDEAFQEEGKFSQLRFETILAQNGYNPARYMSALQSDTVLQQMIQGLAESSFVTKQDLQQKAALLNETRDVSFLRFSLADEIAGITIDEADINSWYQENESSFMTEESLVVSYIHISPEDFFTEVTPDQVRDQYESELQSLDKREEKRVAHILVESDEDSAPAKIIELQQRLDDGEDFAEVAKSASEDIASALMGGELGVTKGDTFPEDFEAEVAKLEPGIVSEPVKTEAGWHLIKVLSVSPFSLPSFEENKERLEYEIQLAQAQTSFPSKVETLADISFNASDLTEPAEVLAVDVKISEPFTRNDAANLGAPFNNPAVVRAAFSEEVLQDGNNSELIELEDGSAVVVRVKQHNKPVLRELADVRQEIEAELKQEKASELLSARVDAVLASLADKALSEIASDKQNVEQLQALERHQFVPDRNLITEAFTSSIEQGVVKVELSNGDFALLQVTAVTPGELKQEQQLEQRLQQMYSTDDFARFQKSLEMQAEIVIHDS